MDRYTEINGHIRIDTNDEQNHLASCYLDIDEKEGLFWEKIKSENKRTHISLWGEIKNFSNEKKIIDWIISKTNHFYIRSGIIEIIVEEKDLKFIMNYDSFTQKWDISQKSF